MSEFIPFNRPPLTGTEIALISDALERRELNGNGHYTTLCNNWLQKRTGAEIALLTQSCTAALEMAAILCRLEPGDEVIMPSFTFVSTANAVVLRGAIPVFVDVRPDTLNIDEALIESAISERTRAIFAVHYGGVPCEMDAINEIARRHDLLVVEDAAQALLSNYRGRPAGSLGDLGCFSFHASKNVVSGEGGALVSMNSRLTERAHIIWEKGTNRRAFLNGAVDKYSWVDLGSSFLPSEITAAFLAAQLERADDIIRDRVASWRRYHVAFTELGLRERGMASQTIPTHVQHNGHLFYLLMRDVQARDAAIESLRERQIATAFHYVPLHSTPAGKRFGRTAGSLAITEEAAKRQIRLPLWFGMGEAIERVINEVSRVVLALD